MFRRLASRLPKDPYFPADLEGLGYFINEDDEVRSIEDPKAYFKFFLTKNDRYNRMQRSAMNEAISNIIFERLTKLGLKKIRLPLGTPETAPHVPIFISNNLQTKERIIVLFYENNQDLGVLAHRIIGGKGGINAGSVINMVKFIQGLETSPTCQDSPGIILANIGQLQWWRRGKQAVSLMAWNSLPQKSAVEPPYFIDDKDNTVPGNRNTQEHVEYMFEHVIKKLASPTAKLNVIGVVEGANQVTKFFDRDQNWEKWGGRMEAYASIATFMTRSDLHNEGFKRWLEDRGRVYATSDEPCGAFLAGADGSIRRFIPDYGCPTFSLGEAYITEVMLPKGYMAVLDWFQEVAARDDYANPEFQRYDTEENDIENWEEGEGVVLTPVAPPAEENIEELK